MVNTRHIVLGMLSIGLSTLLAYSASANPSGRKNILILFSKEEFAEVAHIDAFERILQTQLKEEPISVEFHHRYLTGNIDKDYAMLKKAFTTDKRWDVVVTNTTSATKFANRYLQNQIPIVFTSLYDPVSSGVIRTMDRPSHLGLTGVAIDHNIRRKTELAMQVARTKFPKRDLNIAFIHTNDPNDLAELEALRSNFSSQANVTLLPLLVEANYDSDSDVLKDLLNKAINKHAEHIDFLWEASGLLGRLPNLTKYLIDTKKIVLVGATQKSLSAGAIMIMQPHPDAVGRKTASMVRRVLKGEKAGKMIPEVPQGMQIGINLKSALKANLVIPFPILKEAGGNILK